MTSVTFLFMACAVLACIPVVTSNEPDAAPVLPVIDLRHPLVSPDSACLFICEMCFRNDLDMLMYCVNSICSPDRCNVVDLVLIGRTCNDTALLDQYVFPKKTNTYSPPDTNTQQETNQ